MTLFVDITRIILNFSIISTFFTVYMVYLYMYDNRKFQETVINITYFCIEKYSHLQISSRKVNKMYLTYIEEPVSSVIEKIKETEIYNECLFLSDFFISKEIYYDDDEYKTSNIINNNEVIEEEEEEEEEEETIDFIKDNQVVYTCSKEELLDLEIEHDFMICEKFENNVSFQKIFHKVPSEEDFEFRNLDYNLLSLIIIPINENEDPLNIQLVGDDYYFWVEKNIINKCFLDYFLETYYSSYFNKINDYQLQIITNDINIYNVKMYENEAFQILENGLEVFDFSYFDMPDLIENSEEDDYDILSLEENSDEEEVVVDEIIEEEIVEEEFVVDEIIEEEVVVDEIVEEEFVVDEIVEEEIVVDEIVVDEIVEEEIVLDEIVEEEIVVNEILEEEIVVDEIVVDEIVVDEVVKEEIVEEEFVVDEIVEEEFVVDEVVKEEIVVDEIVEEEIVVDEVVKEEIVVDEIVEEEK